MQKTILNLLVSFLKIGFFTFGGGYAMLPMIERETVEKYCWITEQELLDIFAISQVTPGVIAVNAATYIGYKIAKFWGSFFATLGVLLPSFVVICVIAAFLMDFMEIKWVAYAFEGIRVCVILLMVFSIIKLAKIEKKTWMFYVILVASFIAATFTGFNVIFILLIAAAVGVAYACLKRKYGVT